MTSLANSSSTRSSSSSFHSSSRYSCSSVSSMRTEDSSGSASLFRPFHDHGSQSLFGEDYLSLPAFGNHPMSSYLPSQGDPDDTFPSYCSDQSAFPGYNSDRESFGSERESFGGCYQGDGKSCAGGYQGDWSHGDAIQETSGRPTSMGVVRTVGDSYFLSADVSQFEPHDVVVMAYNHSIVIHAEKVGDDGSVRDKFTHKSLLPEDMDPLSVSGVLTPEGLLTVSVKRHYKPPTTSMTSRFYSETQL